MRCFLPVGQVGHVAGDCRAVTDFNGRVRSLVGADAVDPVGHVIFAWESFR